jgi:UDP-2,3-diacylglucosamine hydrolase
MRGCTADAIVILGDLFDYWPGSDVVQLDFEGRCAQVLREAAQRRHVALMVGNRDFLISRELLDDLGVHLLPDPTLLRAWQHAAVLLTHGDALCLADAAYQKFRAWTRNAQAQAAFLARPLAERVQMAGQLRHASEAGRRQSPPPEGWADLDFDAAVACLQAAGSRLMVHGHTHRPGASLLAPGFERQVLSDWDLDEAPARAEVLRLRRDGLVRLTPEAATVA